ncbi:class I SAM-dependent methyltransferase [Thiocystis violacea]|uniref:class I SAM-dependent methyltransferase n=1 Tax=Thiocystis violacea TaxID=13725 RepID=UPI001908F05B|nr:class I SAM-dependent methyltransferase [Thiocystis violacea]MBK1721768.1 hypothetical protein [Thiocystis violacea]
MPFTTSEHISPILGEIRGLNPRSILDVGCGIGLYGILCRIFLDLHAQTPPSANGQSEQRARRGVLIDGFEPNPALLPYIPDWVYDDLRQADAMTRLPELTDRSYDLVLALGVLEHLDPESGVQLVHQLKRIGHRVILSTPKAIDLGAAASGPFATYRSQWSEKELAALGFNKFLPHHADWIAIHDPDIGPVAQVSRQISLARRPGTVLGRPLPSPARISRLDELEIKEGLGQIQEALRHIQRQQEVTNDERLSIRYRILSLLGKRQRA